MIKKSPMNILLVPVNDLITHPIITRFTLILTALKEKYDLEFYILRYKKIPKNKSLKREINAQFISYKEIPSDNLILYYIINSISMFMAVLKTVKRRKIDVIIHANLIPSLLAIIVGKIYKIPIIYDYQDHFPESASAYYKGFMRNIVYCITLFFTLINIKYSDIIVTVTYYHMNMIKKYFPEKNIKVIPNGVDTKVFKKIPYEESVKITNIQNVGVKLIFFGSIDPWINFDIVFSVMNKLINDGINVFFYIIGYSHSSYYLDSIKDQINEYNLANNVFIYKSVKQNILVHYINSCDILIVPYKNLVKNQAVPLKILEALASGKMVFVSKIMEIQKHFQNTVYFFDTSEELKSLLIKYHNNELTINEKLIKKKIDEYSWDNIAKKYYRLMIKI